MADDNWQKVREVFDSALQYKPEERRKFVHEACGVDKTLIAEVESLLSSLDGAEGFMETPAVAEVAGVIEADTKKLECGKCFGHYEIIEQIGAGGTGEVYLATDKKLDRQVAVKILNQRFSQDKSNLNRFVQEAKSASTLNHPNILVIHEIGETEEAHYIVSEYIKGATLREVFRGKSLKLSEISDVAVQIANALTAAHEARLIHRDIKSENIMIRPDGYVKVLDFGLAKLVERKNKSILGLEDSTVGQNQTAKGVILGTVNYTSPEQAKGEPVDERTDIFSFGVLIYEMITARTPFAGDSVSETFANLINQEPPPIARFAANAPDELTRIVSKMLRKKADERYQTMKDVLTDLKDLRENLTLDGKSEKLRSPENGNATAILQATTGDANKQTAETNNSFSQQIKQHKPLAAFALAALLVGAIGLGYYFFYAGKSASGADGKKSIAVLPLKPINTANRDELYEVGIADSLIYKFSSMKGFIVRPLSATRKYADLAQDPLAAGREQQVDYVLASNYQLAGGKIRITAQLLNMASGQIEETYKSEKDAGNIFAMQDAIAGEVGNLLLARFATTLSSPKVVRGTNNEEAYRFYLQGRYIFENGANYEAIKAVEAFEQAVRLDLKYAQARAGKALAHGFFSNFGRHTNIQENYQKSIEAINKALALDENLAEAHVALCGYKLNYEWDFDGSERECRRAIELDPDSASAHQVYAGYLSSRGRFDESIAEMKTAKDLEPASLIREAMDGLYYYNARRYDEAVAQFKKVITMNERFGAVCPFLYNTLALQGKYDKAFEWYLKLPSFRDADKEFLQSRRKLYRESGWQSIVQAQVKDIEEGNAAYYLVAGINAEVGNKNKVFQYLEKAFERREGRLVLSAS